MALALRGPLRCSRALTLATGSPQKRIEAERGTTCPDQLFVEAVGIHNAWLCQAEREVALIAVKGAGGDIFELKGLGEPCDSRVHGIASRKQERPSHHGRARE